MASWPNQLFIDNKWIDGASGKTWSVVNPATGETLANVALAEAADVDRAVTAARRAFDEGEWRRMDPLHRGRLLYKFAERIRASLDDLAMTDTLNIGKPIRDTRGWDAPVSADLFETYAGLPDKIHGKCYSSFADNMTMQVREPMGVIAAITPWNYPLTNAAIKLAPILATGNTVVLKPSEVSPLTALMLGQMALEVGFPPGVINVIHGTGAEAGAALIKHPGVDKITFTGRYETGAQMLEAAKSGMKGVLMELGGKTPTLVFPDAPLENVVNAVVTGVFINLGQVCVAGSRLLVHESQHDELLERIIAKAKGLRQGDPTDPNTQLGCLATPLHCQSVVKRVEQGKKEGAKCVLSGPALKSEADCFFAPTIFDQVTPNMTLAREEVFGPVLSVLTYRNEDEAVRMANDCDFGLMANIWSADGTRALRLARQLKAGKIAINGGGGFRGSSPVYGFKRSGFGTELGYEEAANEYCHTKVILYSMSTEKSPWPE
ncbi:MAG: aldehyde dehydrogenase [Planctomycetes bacterium]|nr:aldehyde dehydrogenase [Planctomycetota bacterium]